MTRTVLDVSTLATAMTHLAEVDADFARAIAEVGHPVLREVPRGFSGLMRAIVGQQVSVHAARSIWLRLEEAVPSMEPAEFLALADERLRAVGLSAAKMRYGRSLATDIVEGRIDFVALDGLDDEAAIAMLTQAKGIGRWTAEIYLMFAHGRPDIMPGLDLGLVIAAQHLKKLRKRPDAKRLVRIAEQWRPWRSAAALLLWHYRRNMPDWSARAPKSQAAPTKTVSTKAAAPAAAAPTKPAPRKTHAPPPGARDTRRASSPAPTEGRATAVARPQPRASSSASRPQGARGTGKKAKKR